ncbi:DUF192 domain-containing protein [Marinobacter sp. chi1]|uniref:DUF192 domain-containing protein n=1 Tax=Marinobacter suaedae TaxID=3057675 RepID=A0ABT8W1T7_9GAMM|nr:DUF192 domain-containing protein [Marinobacter sp. chi1]MDO3722218.1 DUF192 domain-containing protein [Marinobacter sp. chi1]
MTFRFRLPVMGFLLFASVSGCAANSGIPQPELPTKQACFVGAGESVPVMLEVARKPEHRQKGLMGRQELPENHGMLFVYPELQKPERGFWMRNTLLTLDIAYISKAGVIGSIRRMEPCSAHDAASCPTYPAGVPFTYAIEMNAGFFEENGLKVGDKLMVGEEQCGPQQTL